MPGEGTTPGQGFAVTYNEPNVLIEVAANDCNGDGFPDECEIAEDPNLDCNGNFILDECELDSDGDGVVDGGILGCRGQVECSCGPAE